MNAPTSSLTLPSPPRGLFFELSDLIMVLGWSEFQDLRMVVELDIYIGGEEYEEVLAFYPSDSEFRRWSMWRTNKDIVAQSTVGRAMHFTSVAGALESLIPVADEAAGLTVTQPSGHVTKRDWPNENCQQGTACGLAWKRGRRSTGR